MTWRDDGCWISRPIDRRTSIAWSADHQIAIKTRAEIQSFITVVMQSGGAHPDRWIMIQGAKIKRFYNAYIRDDLGPPSAIQRSRYFRKRSIMDRYRNRRSFRSDGYEISPYKKACSSSFLDIREEFNPIDCQDTPLSRFS